jgi:hypothetical protein
MRVKGGTTPWRWSQTSSSRSKSFREMKTPRRELFQRQRRPSLQPPLSLQIDKIVTSLNVEHLENLVCRSIPLHTGDMGGLRFQGLAKRFADFKFQPSCSPCSQELEQVADWLGDFLDSTNSRRLPVASLSEVHSFIGKIREDGRNYQAATRSFVAALWMLSQQTPAELSEEQLAITLYRLGSSYGRIGDHVQMKATLKRAFALLEGEPLPQQPPLRKPHASSSASTDTTSTTLSESFQHSTCLWTVQEEDFSDQELDKQEDTTAVCEDSYSTSETNNQRFVRPAQHPSNAQKQLQQAFVTSSW